MEPPSCERDSSRVVLFRDLLLGFSEGDVHTQCEMTVKVVYGNELWRYLRYHIVTTYKEVESCRVEIEYPSPAGAEGTEPYIY